MRKFKKQEIESLYEALKSDEEVLWKGKPKLIPDFPILTTLVLLFISIIFITMLVLLNEKSDAWFVLALFILALGIVGYFAFYSYQHYNRFKNIFYVITNYRLLIFDATKGKISYSKRFNLIKFLWIKETIFNTVSIIFDIDMYSGRLKEIGFINVSDAERVMAIINQHLSHLR